MLDLKKSFILAITLHLCLAIVMWRTGAFGSIQSFQANNLYVNLINLAATPNQEAANIKTTNTGFIEKKANLEPSLDSTIKEIPKENTKTAPAPKISEKVVSTKPNNIPNSLVDSEQTQVDIEANSINSNKTLVAGTKPSLNRQAEVELDKISYPRTARMRGEEGVCSLLLTINEKSQIADAKISKSSGYSRLDEAALKLALDKNAKHRIEVALNNGYPTTSYVQVNIQFKLN